MTWDLINITCRLIVALVVVIKLTRFYANYNTSERIGLGVMGGCALMTVPVIAHGPGSPFDDWAGSWFAAGVLVYITGRLMRNVRHQRANDEMARRFEGRAR